MLPRISRFVISSCAVLETLRAIMQDLHPQAFTSKYFKPVVLKKSDITAKSFFRQHVIKERLEPSCTAWLRAISKLERHVYSTETLQGTMLWNIALGFDKDSRYQLRIQLSAKVVRPREWKVCQHFKALAFCRVPNQMNSLPFLFLILPICFLIQLFPFVFISFAPFMLCICIRHTSFPIASRECSGAMSEGCKEITDCTIHTVVTRVVKLVM